MQPSQEATAKHTTGCLLLVHLLALPPCRPPRPLLLPCRLLQLPGPALDDLGRAVWPVSSSDVSKAYRKLSLLVHPDKAPGPEARLAFEQLKQAYNELKDTDKLVRNCSSSSSAILDQTTTTAELQLQQQHCHLCTNPLSCDVLLLHDTQHAAREWQRDQERRERDKEREGEKGDNAHGGVV